MASNANDYIIYHLDQDGKLVKKYDNTTGRAACLIESINIVRAMLTTDAVKSAFVKMATTYYEDLPNAWFVLDGEEETREEINNNVVPNFLRILQIPVFPLFCISDRLRNLNTTGTSTRVEWENFFPMYAPRMLLNGVVSRKPKRSRCSLAS